MTAAPVIHGEATLSPGNRRASREFRQAIRPLRRDPLGTW